ncbi:MAG: hypothetical protein ACI8Z1_002253 [Candidatus Azotimanducaceae bacterium]|jgi:hypothetical protein
MARSENMRLKTIRSQALTGLLLVMLPLVVASALLSPIKITGPEEIADIEVLNAAVDSLSTKIRQCVASGLAPLLECHCQYPRKLETTRHAFVEVLEKYPEWQNRAVLWWDSSRTLPLNIHLGGVGSRISHPCGTATLSSL